MGRIAELPLIVLMAGLAALAMYVPAAHALVRGEHAVARAFFYPGTVLLFIVAMLALAVWGRGARATARGMLATLAGGWIVLPALMAVPFVEATTRVGFTDAWFEMLSAFTTTGATLFSPDRLPKSVHLWRAMAGWGGGFFAILMAMSVLAPMNLGGVEVISGRAPGRGVGAAGQDGPARRPNERILAHAARLFPVYAGATVVLWIGLVMAGEGAFVALCHAMGTLSTSGISPVGGLARGGAGLAGEGLVFLFLLPALSHRLLAALAGRPDRTLSLRLDPELRAAAAIVAIVAGLVFARHWIMLAEGQTAETLPAALHSIWGAAFTALSFLTTTGFESSDWVTARTWSGLGTPGLMLLGLAIMGGGVGTAAGGVKLLRIHALALHARREMERIVHPASVGGGGAVARRLRGDGAWAACIFFMLFAISIAATTAALAIALPDATFEKLLVLAIAALTTTGQLAHLAADTPVFYFDLNGPAKTILGLAMIVGRVETLALLALFVPDGWRRGGPRW